MLAYNICAIYIILPWSNHPFFFLNTFNSKIECTSTYNNYTYIIQFWFEQMFLITFANNFVCDFAASVARSFIIKHIDITYILLTDVNWNRVVLYYTQMTDSFTRRTHIHMKPPETTYSSITLSASVSHQYNNNIWNVL